jgi:hypothetical protein
MSLTPERLTFLDCTSGGLRWLGELEQRGDRGCLRRRTLWLDVDGVAEESLGELFGGHLVEVTVGVMRGRLTIWVFESGLTITKKGSIIYQML